MSQLRGGLNQGYREGLLSFAYSHPGGLPVPVGLELLALVVPAPVVGRPLLEGVALHRVDRQVRPQDGLPGRPRGHRLRPHRQQLPLVLQGHVEAAAEATARHAACGARRLTGSGTPPLKGSNKVRKGGEKWRVEWRASDVVKAWGGSKSKMIFKRIFSDIALSSSVPSANLISS